jgi:hypothetical protein
MSPSRVTGYKTDMNFGEQPSQRLRLYEGDSEVGCIFFTDPAVFMATIDMLRNEGPIIVWDEDHYNLSFGAEPTGEEES